VNSRTLSRFHLPRHRSMTDFEKFVRYGNIGGLSLLQSRQEVQHFLGSPRSWVGKPPCIGPAIESPEESDVWIFFNGTVGIEFGPDERAVGLMVYPERLRDEPQLFKEWPIGTGATMGEFRDALLSDRVNFQEGNPESEDYWIVAAGDCSAVSFPFSHGRQLHGYGRLLKMILKSSIPESVPAFFPRR